MKKFDLGKKSRFNYWAREQKWCLDTVIDNINTNIKLGTFKKCYEILLGMWYSLIVNMKSYLSSLDVV